MNRLVSVAPMMDCTDRHERYFLRLISKNILLYTEMVVDEAINRGDKKKLLEFIIKRIERSYGKIYEFIYKVDELSLKKKKPIDLKKIREIF